MVILENSPIKYPLHASPIILLCFKGLSWIIFVNLLVCSGMLSRGKLLNVSMIKYEVTLHQHKMFLNLMMISCSVALPWSDGWLLNYSTPSYEKYETIYPYKNIQRMCNFTGRFLEVFLLLLRRVIRRPVTRAKIACLSRYLLSIVTT